MTALMVQGVSSSAGKSLVVTALCRWFARRGVAVAPFKGSNMSNNARVTAEGEIGVAQWLQARACGIEPDTAMNPVLVKPEASGSQVVRRGVVDTVATGLPWRDRAPVLWPTVEAALRELQSRYELVLIEGAGSPAETNLRGQDLANMRVAEAADAPVLLVADIDRGGAFAHLYGTWSLLLPGERARLRGFVLNKFRGDASLLAPAPQDLARRTGMAAVGVLPWVEHGLPEEDSAGHAGPPVRGGRPRVAVVRYPMISNADEFTGLAQVTDLVWATAPVDIAGADLVVLPGSKHTMADIAWLRSRGIDRALQTAAADTPVLGICGGYQMLGERLSDPEGVEGAAGHRDGDGARAPAQLPGLGLLPVETVFAPRKLTEPVRLRFGGLGRPWTSWAERPVAGYEIRHGRVRLLPGAVAALPEGRGVVAGNVLGISVHGCLEDPALVAALLGVEPPAGLDAVFDSLADLVDAHLDTGLLLQLAGVGGRVRSAPGAGHGTGAPWIC